jgi:hypothetical protein
MAAALLGLQREQPSPSHAATYQQEFEFATIFIRAGAPGRTLSGVTAMHALRP